jgi:aldehyde dehydrogenase (NAD+)
MINPNRHLTYNHVLLAANWAALGILYNTGQDCTAGSRLYVQDTIYDKFVTTLAAKAKELVIGDGFDEKSGGGPVVCASPSEADLFSSARIKVSKTQYDRVWSYIESGKKQGARVIVGGERRTTPGYWVDATSSPALLHRSLNADSWNSIHRHSP